MRTYSAPTLKTLLVIALALITVSAAAVLANAKAEGLACGAGQSRTGTESGDVLRGTTSADHLVGRGGDDRLYGARAVDCLDGGAGHDTLVGGPGKDSLLGGPGDDLIRANDGDGDQVDCGDGNDLVVADGRDTLTGCEGVTRETDENLVGSYDYSVTFRSTYANPVVAATDDPAIICAHSVDHPTIAAGSPANPTTVRTAFQVQQGAFDGCAYIPSVVKWILKDETVGEAGYVSVSVWKGSGTVSCQPLKVPCSVDVSQQVVIG